MSIENKYFAPVKRILAYMKATKPTDTAFTAALQTNLQTLKDNLTATDVLTFNFVSANQTPCAIIYADGMVNKQLIGELIALPLSRATLPQSKDSEGESELLSTVMQTVKFPEIKSVDRLQDTLIEILDGNCALLVEGVAQAIIVGTKLLPIRTIAEPPTDVATKGPREGFIEDIKTDMTLLRKRLKSPALQMQTLRVGKQSQTMVCVCYLEGTANEKVVNAVLDRLKQIQIDCIPDSSYIATLLSPRSKSVFRTVGTTEKPDIFAAKLSEGRVGILVDGSPIALTLPFILLEDFQTSEDYFISPFVASLFRLLRFISLLVALMLPAFYVSAQLFKMQLLPVSLILTIASSVRELPLSPSLEMFVVLFLLEILKEASIRMPKYVGMSLSVVGALVLGETAVSAGFLSTPAIIIVAFSGICLYTVPNFVETGSILRLLFLLVAGSLGTFGIILFSAFILYYLLGTDSYGAPLLAPFSPLVPHDLKDGLIKYNMYSLATRPKLLKSENTKRLKND